MARRVAGSGDTKDQDVTITLIRNCRFAVVWDDEAQSPRFDGGVIARRPKADVPIQGS
jgi:hypothetical protein